MYTQSYFERSKPKPHHDRAKTIVKGRTIITLGNHHASEGIEGTYERLVNKDHALSYHYRDRHTTVYKGKSIKSIYNITDTTLMKYDKILYRKVNDVCEKVYEDGICPCINIIKDWL